MPSTPTPERILRDAAWIVAHRHDLRSPAGKQLVDLVGQAIYSAELIGALNERRACEKIATDRMDHWTGLVKIGGSTIKAHQEEAAAISNLIAERSTS